jgi:Zn-dependent M28 family amino/carboxypeptidase
MGIATRRTRFEWRGIPQSNLVAVLPGRLPPERNRPVLIADHYDTAFAEDAFLARGERVSAPGADDNVSATAALLRAAEALRGLPLRHDVWLVHLTGEEFPADDLGAREFVARELLRKGRRIQGLLLLDMIAWREGRDPVFQINPGPGEGSAFLAAVARSAALREPSVRRMGLVPVVRPAYDSKSYLYNTDGVIFATAGYPVILFNEHINALENFERPHYHQSSDRPGTVDFDYAEAIVRTAIETAARLATARGM